MSNKLTMDIPNTNTLYTMDPWPIPDESVHWFDSQQESLMNESQATRDSLSLRGDFAELNPESAHTYPGRLRHDADGRNAHPCMGSMEIDELSAQQSALDTQKKINILLNQSSNNSQRFLEAANATEDFLFAHADNADLNRGGTQVHPGRSGRDADGRDTQPSMDSMEIDQPFGEFNTQQLVSDNPIFIGLTPTQPLDDLDTFQQPGIIANEAQATQDSTCLQGDGMNSNHHGALAQPSRSGSVDRVTPYQANHTFRVELPTSKLLEGHHKTPVACLRCHHQKHKCDGHAPCQRCINAEAKCIYPDEEVAQLASEVSILEQGMQVLDLRIKKFGKQRQVTDFDGCEQTASYYNENAKAKFILTKNGSRLKFSNCRQLCELLESLAICAGIHRGPAYQSSLITTTTSRTFDSSTIVFIITTIVTNVDTSFATIEEEYLLKLILEKSAECKCPFQDNAFNFNFFMPCWPELWNSAHYAAMCYAFAAANAAHIIEQHADITQLGLKLGRNITQCQLKDLSALVADQYFHKADELLKDLLFGDDPESADLTAVIALFVIGRYQLKSKDSASNVYIDMAIRIAMHKGIFNHYFTLKGWRMHLYACPQYNRIVSMLIKRLRRILFTEEKSCTNFLVFIMNVF